MGRSRGGVICGLVAAFASLPSPWAFGSTTTSYSYDGLGRLASVTYPCGSSATYSYDQVGFLTKTVWVAPTAPTASAVSTSVVKNTTNNPIPLSISCAPNSVAVTSGPSHGTVTITQTVITYTPTSNYTGTDSFNYTATNAGGTSAAKTVTITVTAS